MNLPIFPSVAATNDITELYCFFIAQDANLGGRFLECLNATYEMISHMPELGELYRFRDPAMKNVRIRSVKKFSNYLIFYRIETNRIEILRVLHGARDYINLFNAKPLDD